MSKPIHKIRVDLEKDGYDIFVGCDLISELAKLISPLIKPSRIMVVTNPQIQEFYGTTVRAALASVPCDVVCETIPEGEQHKNIATVERLLDKMVGARLDRSSLLVSLGGGVVGDIAGFAAAIYARGIPYVQVPTTLLAQVDSSIGGKVGVDHPLAKNMIGAFYQPLLVCIDPAVLASLPDKEMQNGMAEVIKYGVIADEGLFSLLERHSNSLKKLDAGLLEDTIKRCCQIKARIIQQDVHETTGLRVLLNYGHTIGHAIESVTGYRRFSHGEAVAIGMMTAAKIARILKLLPEEAEKRQERLLLAAGLPTRLFGVAPQSVIEAVKLDKKASAGQNRFVLPRGIGRVVVKENIPPGIIEQALKEIVDD
ncbi:MAG: 3-dehydroquinate synthase [Candidatus Abyssubacteria bacterium]